jgi:hypothetical protein
MTDFTMHRENLSAGDPVHTRWRGGWAAGTVQSIALDHAIVNIQRGSQQFLVPVWDPRNLRACKQPPTTEPSPSDDQQSTIF